MILAEQVPGAPMDIEFSRTTLCLVIVLALIAIAIAVKNK